MRQLLKPTRLFPTPGLGCDWHSHVAALPVSEETPPASPCLLSCLCLDNLRPSQSVHECLASFQFPKTVSHSYAQISALVTSLTPLHFLCFAQPAPIHLPFLSPASLPPGGLPGLPLTSPCTSSLPTFVTHLTRVCLPQVLCLQAEHALPAALVPGTQPGPHRCRWQCRENRCRPGQAAPWRQGPRGRVCHDRGRGEKTRFPQ